MFGLGKGPKLGRVNHDELNEMLADKSVKRQFIDVRTPDEVSMRKVKGFKNIPLQVFQNRVGELKKDQPVILICASGSRSASAGRFLLSQGFEQVFNVRRGLIGYR